MRTPPRHADRGTYFIRTFGCQMNAHDSEHVAGVLESAGYLPAGEPGGADVVVFNTCSVRAGAEDRAWGNFSALQAAGPDRPLVAVFGCMAQRFGVEILNRCPAVDLVFGLDSLERLPGLLEECRSGRICDTGDTGNARYDDLPSRPRGVATAWVPVSHGCDNYCSYCVVPFVRGPHRSRPTGEILEEVRRLVEGGVIEVTLLGQNVNSYGGDTGEAGGFALLLDRVASVPGLRRVKFETSHPADLSDGLLGVMAAREAACEYLHLPVQSGSNRVLSRMNRKYDREYYCSRVERARELVPGVAISTDIMVGFPGETDADFEDSLELVSRVRFDGAYIFRYSRREETAASGMGGEVEPGEVSRRFNALRELQDGITAEHLVSMVGTHVEVLAEGPAKSGAFVTGRTRGHRVVLLPAGQAPPGTLVEAAIESAGRRTLRGSVARVVAGRRGA